MAKKISMEVESCLGCPFCQHDSHYTRSRDSGYDCKHQGATQSRIIDDNDYKEQVAYDPETNTDSGNYAIPFPGWCPLPDA
jgi:hypothetical protein